MSEQTKGLSGVEAIRKALKTLPEGAGVYRMLNAKSEVLYVGKAKNIKKRVTSYTHITKLSLRIQRMVVATTSLEIVTTETEAEALLLEANFIKHFHPRYNILLKDDKSFPYIAIDSGHDYPRIAKHRGAKKKGVQYFGPYASAGDVNRAIASIQKMFLLRPCADTVFANRKRPCMEHQIKRCSAPCVGYIEKAPYGKLLRDATDFLEGKNRHLQEALVEEMEAASAAQDYEKAGAIRDRIQALTVVQSSQHIHSNTVKDADIIGLHMEAEQICVQVFIFRHGQPLGNKSYFPQHMEGCNADEVMEAFLGRFYQSHEPPPLLLLSHDTAGRRVLEEALGMLVERKVRIYIPQKGEKAGLVGLASENAKDALARRMRENESERKLIEKLVAIFALPELPARIEVFDNSHISGKYAVGAMIVAGPEGFEKQSYRKFTVESTSSTGGDDYGMLREVLTRRYGRLQKEDPDKEQLWPGLILIDGGAGHKKIAEEVFADIGVSEVPFVCIAKGKDRNAGREVFHMTGKKPFTLPKSDAALYYLQRLRDEAHRFAIMSHRAKRAKGLIKSELDGMEGVGPKRKKALLHHFGSVKGLKAAGLEDIAKVEGISKTLAQQIHDQLHG